jgi:eukaryotic-like serine/threonine-protein kinase
VGATLGQKYKLGRLLGEGGMGAVYEAEQLHTGQRVAVKIIHSRLLKPGKDGARRFRREARAASAVNSDHIVQVFDSGVDEATGILFMAMECLEGEDLQQLFARVGPLQPDCALRIFAQALVGLQKAHEAHIVHRDLKPANLFLARSRNGAITVKILDFGIAKLDVDPLRAPRNTSITDTSGFLGSPLYMSPEHVQNSREVDHRTDIWSLGSALYCALAGRAPHEHIHSVGQLLVAICVSQPPDLLTVAPWVPPEVAKVVHGALERRVAARYASATAMFEAIVRLLPAGYALREEMLTPIGERTRVALSPTTLPGTEPASRRIAVDQDATQTLFEDEPTEQTSIAGGADTQGASTPTIGEGESSSLARHLSSVDRASSTPSKVRPKRLENAEGSRITVDPRNFLGAGSEPWTFPFDAQELLSSFLASVYHALRDAGAKIPPRTYGQTWILFDPRTQRTLKSTASDEHEALRFRDALIEPGIELWVMTPESVPREKDGAPPREPDDQPPSFRAGALLETMGKRYRVGNGAVILTSGDITRESTDAIVNATDSRLSGTSGVDRAIHMAAGPGLFAACQKLIEAIPGEQFAAGEAAVTPGFQLTARHVIHCVGPSYDQAAATAPNDLNNCLRSAFRICRELGLRSIAFPAIGTGVIGYAMDEAATLTLSVIQRELFVHRLPTLVRLVLFDPAAYHVFAACADRRL